MSLEGLLIPELRQLYLNDEEEDIVGFVNDMALIPEFHRPFEVYIFVDAQKHTVTLVARNNKKRYVRMCNPFTHNFNTEIMNKLSNLFYNFSPQPMARHLLIFTNFAVKTRGFDWWLVRKSLVRAFAYGNIIVVPDEYVKEKINDTYAKCTKAKDVVEVLVNINKKR